jgi:hypothetical protein
MFRLSSCLLLGGASAFTDETSLMQGLKPPVQDKHRQDKAAVANLLESAKGMLKSGETSDVVQFAQATLEEITNGVMPAMLDGHAAEQQLLIDHFAAFAAAEARLDEARSVIRNLAAEQENARQGHMSCRVSEDGLCQTKKGCDYDLFGFWRAFASEEAELRMIEDRFTNHYDTSHPNHNGQFSFCLGNGTTFDFRRDAVPIMDEFKRQWPEVIAAKYTYDQLQPQCEVHYSALMDETADCDALQTSLESLNCQHILAVSEANDAFSCAWSQAVYTYDRTEKEARLMMLDRIREFRMLETVKCLLERTTERNGRPCDESTGEVDTEVAACEDTHRDLDISHLELNFPCEERQCGNSGLTGTGPYLNDDGSTNPGCAGPLVCPLRLNSPPLPDQLCVRDQIFPGLPSVPEPEFFWENSDDKNTHCNPRPTCSGCEPILTHACALPEWDWGANSYRHPDAHYPDGSAPQACCRAMTASCLACQAGVDEATFCADSANRGVSGCVSIMPVTRTED